MLSSFYLVACYILNYTLVPFVCKYLFTLFHKTNYRVRLSIETGLLFQLISGNI
jgi:hypothetical protein